MKNRFSKAVLVGLFIFSLLGFRAVANAAWLDSAWSQTQHAAGTTGANLGEPVDPRLIVAQIVKLLLSLVGTILLVLIIWAGYKWMTAQGNENAIAESKKTIINATIGLIIILSAYAITILVTNLALGRKLSTGVNSGGTLDSAVEGWFK